MELQLKKILAALLLIGLLACSYSNKIEGNWGALDEKNNYSELFFETNDIRVYSEIGGIIPPLTYFIKGDSLLTNILNYKITMVNHDSLVLESEYSILYLKRINEGFRLSDFTNENLENTYTNNFYDRMYKRKGISPAENINSVDSFIPSVKEETIEIRR